MTWLQSSVLAMKASLSVYLPKDVAGAVLEAKRHPSLITSLQIWKQFLFFIEPEDITSLLSPPNLTSLGFSQSRYIISPSHQQASTLEEMALLRGLQDCENIEEIQIRRQYMLGNQLWRCLSPAGTAPISNTLIRLELCISTDSVIDRCGISFLGKALSKMETFEVLDLSCDAADILLEPIFFEYVKDISSISFGARIIIHDEIAMLLSMRRELWPISPSRLQFSTPNFKVLICIASKYLRLPEELWDCSVFLTRNETDYGVEVSKTTSDEDFLLMIATL